MCMHVCVCAYMYMCMHVCTYVCLYACVRVCVFVCMRACVCIYVYVHARVHICVLICMRACVRVCVHVCVRVCEISQQNPFLHFRAIYPLAHLYLGVHKHLQHNILETFPMSVPCKPESHLLICPAAQTRKLLFALALQFPFAPSPIH